MTRIITFAPSSTEIIAALGAADRLIAVGTFCNYPAEVASLPKTGGLFDPDLEAILRLQPDLLITRGRNQAVERLCAENDIRLYGDPTEDLDGVYQAIRDLGELLDRREAAAREMARIQGRLAEIAAAVAGRPRPRVLFTVSRRDPAMLAGILTASRGTFIDQMIACAGGENVFAHLEIDYPEVSLEAILSAQPEVIIEAMPEARPDSELQARVRGVWASFSSIPAVKNGRVYVLTEDNTLVPSPRVVETVARLARLLHPEAAID